MGEYVIDLHELGDGGQELVGGKGRGLARLVKARLPVPPGFVVTTKAYLKWAETCSKGLNRDCPEDVWAEVFEAYQRLIRPYPGVRVVVRSSASVEDNIGSSYAGQFRTLLGVSSEDSLKKAVIACWESLSNVELSSYAPAAPGSQSQAERPASMAVVVQLQVPAEVSGVLFTLNPQSGRENEMLVEASWGLGEAVVSGLANPDRYVLDIEEERVSSVEVNDKRLMVVSGWMRVRGYNPIVRYEGADVQTSGSLTVEVPPDLRRARTLQDRDLLRLMDLGVRVQTLFGLPVDVEWALWNDRFFVLQARPMTAFSFAPDFGTWTSANFREVMPGFASYLSQSMSFHHDFAMATEEVFARLRLRRKEDENVRWSSTIFGHGYWNVGAAKRVASRVPGFRERAFDRTVGIPITYQGDGLVTPWSVSTVFSALPSLFALRRQYRVAVKEAEQFVSWYEASEPEWDRVDPALLDDPDLAKWVKFAVDLHWRTNRWALIISLLGTQAQDDFHASLEKINARLGKGEKRISEAKLLTGLSRIATARPVAAVWELARFAAEHLEVLGTIRARSAEELANIFRQYLKRQDACDSDLRCSSGQSGPGCDGAESRLDEDAVQEFWRRFEDCLRTFRYMSEVDEDLSVPRWGEEPELLLSMVKACLSGEMTLDPNQQIARQERVRQEEEKRAREILKKRFGRIFFPLVWKKFKSELDLVRRLAWWREETRVYLSRARYHTRRFLKEQGSRWAKAGVLQSADDVFWLSRDEVLGLLEGTADVPAVQRRVKHRRRIPIMYRNFVPPAVIAPGWARILPVRTPRKARTGEETGEVQARVYLEQSAREETPSVESVAVYTGIGCSGGSVTGRARVVRSLQEASSLESGEVLVAPFANPGWTPLFSVACAIVLEEGGLLSHSAVVAREYGIPAVLQVEGATSKIRTGDLLLVDGSRGTVEVLKRAGDALKEEE